MDALKPAVATIAETSFRTVVFALAVYGALDIARGALAQDEFHAYAPYAANAAHVESLDERVAALEDKLVHVSREGNDLYVTGANLHVLNGKGATNTTNGLGNVVVGYNESGPGATELNDRSGSHMLVLGKGSNYSSYGGIVAGSSNQAAGAYASVLGGTGNAANGTAAVVLGGHHNEASGDFSTIGGGGHNAASGWAGSAYGGANNVATGNYAVVVGGDRNVAGRANSAVVLGGCHNEAVGYCATVTGGTDNRALGMWSSVGGGASRETPDDCNWRAGDLFQDH